MDEGRVVHVNDAIPDAVYIGRRADFRGLSGSPFGNPYPIGRDHSVEWRDTILEAYETMIRSTPELMHRLPELRGKPLACWCRHDGQPPTPETRCHGDILLLLLREYDDKALRSWTYEPPPPDYSSFHNARDKARRTK